MTRRPGLRETPGGGERREGMNIGKRLARNRLALAAGALVCLALGAALYFRGRSLWVPVYLRVRGRRTMESAIGEYGLAAEKRLAPHFRESGVPYPPKRVVLITLKTERRIELWASADGPWRHVRDYPILAASGEPGPKLRRGDGQVPEGIYHIEGLNPNSSYHLSMKLDYPNAFDRERAAADGRADPGDNIFIHGKAVSIGCIAVGDAAIEELFTLVAASGASSAKVLIAPNDLRVGPARTGGARPPAWTSELYDMLQAELAPFRRPHTALQEQP